MDPVLQLDRSVLAVPAYEDIGGVVDVEVGGHEPPRERALSGTIGASQAVPTGGPPIA